MVILSLQMSHLIKDLWIRRKKDLTVFYLILKEYVRGFFLELEDI